MVRLRRLLAEIPDGPLDGQVGRLGAVQDLRHQTGCLPEIVGQVWPIGHEALPARKAGKQRNRREAMRHGQSGEVLAVIADVR